MPHHALKSLFLLAIVSAFYGCQPEANYSAGSVIPKMPDYAADGSWSIKTTAIKHPVDVFFVHPTTYGPPSNGHYNADIYNRELNNITDSGTIDWITAAFAGNCNVFAPRYRQMNIEVLSMPPEKQAPYESIAIGDVTAAFKYYLKNLNNGRPFIIASHSQGSKVMKQILTDNPEILDRDKLVAAYMPGWTFTEADLEDIGLKLGESANQTGCLVTWNTIGDGGKSPTLLPGAKCVNPLSWTSGPEEISADRNLGAKIYLANAENMEIANFTSAYVNKQGGLVVPTPDEAVLSRLNMSMGAEVYHRYDYDFFFNNVKENVKLRCDSYLK